MDSAQQELPRAIFLMGATATGKTDLAIKLTSRFPCEIISVDSALIYQHMDIGTAKPDKTELEKAPHFLIDIISPQQSYSVWEFRNDALELMHTIQQRGNIPLLVGGTMMYFNALENGLNQLPEANQDIRCELLDLMHSQGLNVLHNKLKLIDPVSAAKIEPSDQQRIIRALEVYQITGKALSEHHKNETQHVLPFQLLKLILAPSDRQNLHYRIGLRFQKMLEDGLINEVRNLINQYDLNLDHPAMRCVGYRQVYEFLQQKTNEKDMVDKACAATRQLAKRQITWLRKQENAHWFDSDKNFELEIERLVESFLN